MRRAHRREVVGDGASIQCGRLGETVTEARVARIDPQLRPGLGIREPHLADVDELLLPRVADLDREHIVVAGEVDEPRTPVARTAEVRDDGDERALAGDRPEQRQRRPELGRCAASRALVAEREQQADEPCAALPRWQRHGAPAPNETSPTRLPRTLAA